MYRIILHAAAYNLRGEIYRNKGDHARAMADFEQAVKLDPALAAARQNRDRAQAALRGSRP